MAKQKITVELEYCQIRNGLQVMISLDPPLPGAKEYNKVMDEANAGGPIERALLLSAGRRVVEASLLAVKVASGSKDIEFMTKENGN